MDDGNINIAGTQPLEDFLQVFRQLRADIASTKSEFETAAGSALFQLEEAVISARADVDDARYALNRAGEDDDRDYLQQDLENTEAYLRDIEYQANNVKDALRKYRSAASELDRLKSDRIPKAISFLEQRIEAIKEYQSVAMSLGLTQNPSFNVADFEEIIDVLPTNEKPKSNKPKRRKIIDPDDYVLYQEGKALFRSDSRLPTEIRKEEGFKFRGKNKDINKYVNRNVLSMFIGTTKSFKAAKKKALQDAVNNGVGYVYMIDSRGIKGVDVNQTLGEHDFYKEQEVAFIEEIDISKILFVFRTNSDGTIEEAENI